MDIKNLEEIDIIEEEILAEGNCFKENER